MEFFSLTGTHGTQPRATVSSFGPILLGKVLSLTDTQQSVLAMVFKYCDDKRMPLLDFADLRSILNDLAGDGKAELKDYGSMSAAQNVARQAARTVTQQVIRGIFGMLKGR